MKKGKKRQTVKNRLPEDMIRALRQGTGIGPHCTKKGKRGYNRNEGKQVNQD